MTNATPTKPLGYELPKLLQHLMDKHKLTHVRDIANVADINEQTLYDNLRGDTQMSLKNGLKLSEAFGLSDQATAHLLKEIQKHFDSKRKGKKTTR